MAKTKRTRKQPLGNSRQETTLRNQRVTRKVLERLAGQVNELALLLALLRARVDALEERR